MKEEIWKDVIGYEGVYRISNQGRVMSLKHGKTRIMADRMNNKGYIDVLLYKNKRTKSFYVARLVAQHFLPDWDKSLQVDHINGERTNNHVDNLRMVTHSQNLKSYSKKREGVTSKFRGVCWMKDRKKWRARITVDQKNKYLGYFDDEEEAARAWDAAAIENGFNPEALNFK